MHDDITVKVKRVGAECTALPEYATAGAAGLDLAASIGQPITIAPHARVLIPTGMAIEMPHRHLVGLVFARSGLAAKHGVCLANGVGVIDSDYTGEIICALYNSGGSSYVVHPGDRIAQLVFVPVAVASLVVVEGLAETARGSGGFGSTG
jgi:dUTP pyrophosphatase